MAVVNDLVDDLVIEAFNLSMDVSDLHLAGKLTLEEDDESMVYGHCDGLEAKWIEKMASGRCSLSDAAAFDASQVEADLRKDIKTMKAILGKEIG
jgi:hypothetical protein